MHKIQYIFVKKRNKCDLAIKSIITKNTISGKKKVETINESTKRETNWRERESIHLFCKIYCKTYILYMSNIIDTNYFTTFLQNVDVTNHFLVFI